LHDLEEEAGPCKLRVFASGIEIRGLLQPPFSRLLQQTATRRRGDLALGSTHSSVKGLT